MATQKDAIKLHADLSRAPGALDGFLAGINLDSGAVQGALSIDAAALDQRSLELSRTAFSLLPIGRLSATQRRVYGAQSHGGLSSYAWNTAAGLRLYERMATELTPDRIEDLLAKRALYEGFERLGGRVANSGLDVRLLCGAFLWFLVERVLGALQPRITGAASPRERERLLDEFGPALVAIDRLLRYPQERKELLAARRAELGKEVADAEADAQLAETILRLKQNMPIEREALLAAARHHEERQREAGAAAPRLPEAAAPASGTPRRIVE